MKKSLVVVGLMTMLVLAGCSSNSSSNSSSDNAKTTKTESSTAYQNLSKSNKKDLKFKVHLDNKKSGEETYDLSMTIRNNSDKTVKINKAKFSLMSDGESKYDSDKTGTITLKAGQKKGISQLFKEVDSDTLSNGKVTIQYMNDKNVVATPDFTDQVKPAENTDDSATSATNNDTNNNASDNSNSAAATDDTANRVVKSGAQAIQMYEASYGSHEDTSGFSVTDTGSGYQIDTGTGTAFVSYNGDITDDNGTKSYDMYKNANGPAN